ncbi:sulfide/dihydroorotate dehydrogenase-like FAD/NAD-binding protein [Pelolinea submarina]|uniref:Sulfide dehydrogenase (Flavoprotein) subunit SudB n=1 Tax=Pelolinea submarina TaxID=913107 RepID=A0A347ZW84_9CHLR|nr:sulfide/dihydroorotate dehydrogenase-like FAD/NAD-binding protein [Pelolinea submarina]REG07262.1 sulfide dehydrogenase (flavoprotein) subunit SudB [Pelolinea submarina]BBB49565.1 ferredoxin--NADP+ reductase [Pelolinea submarina]
MFEIKDKTKIAPDIYRLEIEAPLIAKKFKAGQFIVLRPLETSERVPLTIMKTDPQAGTITLIVKAIGLSTRQLCALEKGQTVADLLGPLGKSSEIENYGTVVIVGGGVGTAVAFAVAQSLKEAGNRIITISGARDQSFVILEDDLREISDELIMATDDGSYGVKGFVTEQLKGLYARGEKIDRVIAAGPLPMMRFISDITREHNTPTVVSLNPIMVDGIGMCGGCRALVGGKIVFVCVDGPEFDAHQVDFDSLMRRNNAYRGIEQEKEHACKLEAEIETVQHDQ